MAGPAPLSAHRSFRRTRPPGFARQIRPPGFARQIRPPGFARQTVAMAHEGLQAKVVTVSDGVIAGTRQDRSGDALAACLADAGWTIAERRQIPDGIESVRDTIVEMAAGFAGLIVTTGGTGFGPRDLTPEGTLAAVERQAPGLAEAARLVSPLGRLSRAVAGTRGRVLILNTPGSTSGTVECVTAVLDVLPHAVELLAGGRPH